MTMQTPNYKEDPENSMPTRERGAKSKEGSTVFLKIDYNDGSKYQGKGM